MKQHFTFLALFVVCFLAADRWLEPVEYDVTVSYVNVWVKATDKQGKPITDLRREDLTVMEDGKPVNSECFEQAKYDIINNEDPFAEFNVAPTKSENGNSSKKFIIFLDLFNTTMGELRYMQPRIQDFLLHDIDYKSDVMLAALLPNRKMGVLIPFTRNHEQVADEIRKAPGNQTRDTRIAENEQQLLGMIRDWEAIGRDTDSPSDFYRRAVGMIRVLSREEKEHGMFTLKALRSFSDYLATADLGEHTVIVYVSGGFSAEPGRQYYTLLDSAMQRYLADMKAKEPDVVVENPEQDFEVVNAIKTTAWYLNRLNVTLYCIDSRGLVPMGQDSGSQNTLNLPGGSDYFAKHSHEETLSYLARHTGGLAFTGTQNFVDCFVKMVADLNHQYLVCYRAPEHKKKGFHRIEVVTKRPGINLRYRNGYLS